MNTTRGRSGRPAIPSPQQTHRAVVRAMKATSTEWTFGLQLLTAGKRIGIGREKWVSKKIAAALVEDGFEVETEKRCKSGRIDIAILDAQKVLSCLIEVKFYFCHQHRLRECGHRFINNTLKDFNKRRAEFPDLPQQAIVFVADYQSMPQNGKKLALYNAEEICRYLAKRGPSGFSRFEYDLFDQYASICTIVPPKGKSPSSEVWTASYKGAKANICAWVLEFQ